jgi:hypothetical protein
MGILNLCVVPFGSWVLPWGLNSGAKHNIVCTQEVVGKHGKHPASLGPAGGGSWKGVVCSSVFNCVTFAVVLR